MLARAVRVGASGLNRAFAIGGGASVMFRSGPLWGVCDHAVISGPKPWRTAPLCGGSCPQRFQGARNLAARPLVAASSWSELREARRSAGREGDIDRLPVGERLELNRATRRLLYA